MSIDLHCTKCRKLIRAPDQAGGRHGKCPYCGERVYIPMPENEVEPLAVTPINEEEERREEVLRRESIDYVSAVEHAGSRATDGGATGAAEAVDIAEEVEAFVSAMHQSRLDQADAATKRLKRTVRRSREHVNSLLDGEPAAFGDVPAPLVQGFLKNLLGRLE